MSTQTDPNAASETPVSGSESGDTTTENPQSSSTSSESSASDANPEPSSGATDQTPPTGDPVVPVAPVETASPGEPTPFTDSLGITQVADDFAGYFAKKIVPFLDVIDVFDVNERRKALHAIVKKEDEIMELFEYSKFIITLMIEFATKTQNSDLIVKVDTYFGKYGRMKQWIGV